MKVLFCFNDNDDVALVDGLVDATLYHAGVSNPEARKEAVRISISRLLVMPSGSSRLLGVDTVAPENYTAILGLLKGPTVVYAVEKGVAIKVPVVCG